MATSRPRVGRPRSEAARAAILRSAYTLLAARGYAAMSMEAVAADAGVSKATIYKWWPERALLAVDAFFERTKDELILGDTSDAAGDFRRQIHALADVLRRREGAAFAALIQGARIDPMIGKAVAERWVIPRKRWGIERMQRAIARGECFENVDIDAALATLYSIVYSPLLLGVGVPPGPQLDACLDIAFAGIFRTSARSR